MNSLWLVHDTITSVKERLASCLHVWCLVFWMLSMLLLLLLLQQLLLLLLLLRYCAVAGIEMSCSNAK